MTARRWLFLKERFAWPRASGHDVHTYHLMRSLAEAGHEVSIATLTEPPPQALAGITFADRFVLETTPEPEGFPLNLTKSQAKFRDYWGVSAANIRKFAACAEKANADCVVVSGLNVLPYLGAVRSKVRAWYAADEWVWHHFSQVKLGRRGTWGEIKAGLVKGYYERSYRGLVDRVWAVSPADVKAFRRYAGMATCDLIPNGVDAAHYRPDPAAAVRANHCVFWGRLDFGPNIQAIEHFVAKIWPVVRRQVPGATFGIYGFQPTDAVRKLAGRDGITLTADLPDIRPAVREASAVVLPFVSGGGIKNKLLEACAMGVPVVGSPKALTGLSGRPPVVVCRTPAEWARALKLLFADAAERQSIGDAGREWVAATHTWAAAARAAADGLEQSFGGHR